MLFLYVILFLIFGYSFVLCLINAIKEEISSHIPALLFIIWSFLAITVSVELLTL